MASDMNGDLLMPPVLWEDVTVQDGAESDRIAFVIKGKTLQFNIGNHHQAETWKQKVLDLVGTESADSTHQRLPSPL